MKYEAYLRWHSSANARRREKEFWDKVNIKGEDDCWEIETPTGKNPYPLGQAYRRAWIYTNGVTPPSRDENGRRIVIRHLCGNKRCVNPRHLKLGTDSENMRDRYALSGGKKLIEEKVRRIREYRKRGFTYDILAKMFNVSIYTVRCADLGIGAYRDME